MNKFNLSRNAAAFITGAAGGIGSAVAVELAKRGCHLALIDKDEPGLKAVGERLKIFKVRASLHHVDVTDIPAMENLVSQVEREHGGIHLLINCAGVSLFGSVRQLSLEEFRWLLDNNVWGTIATTKLVLPVLEKQPSAHIVNLSSVYGLAAPAGRAPYATSKFAVRGFTESLRHELESSRISVGVIMPGGTMTQIAMRARVAKAVNPDVALKAKQAQTALYKMSPEFVANEIVNSIEERKGRVVIGPDANKLDVLSRLFPSSYWNFIRKKLAAAINTGDNNASP